MQRSARLCCWTRFSRPCYRPSGVWMERECETWGVCTRATVWGVCARATMLQGALFLAGQVGGSGVCAM